MSVVMSATAVDNDKANRQPTPAKSIAWYSADKHAILLAGVGRQLQSRVGTSATLPIKTTTVIVGRQ